MTGVQGASPASRRRIMPSVVAGGAALVLAFCGTVAIRGYGPLEAVTHKLPLWSGRRPAYRPEHRFVTGHQLVMVYFGSSHCMWANRPHARDVLERIKLALAQRAHRQGWSFEAVGVALDWDTKSGIRYLERVGQFDEVASGYNWGNIVATRYFGDEVKDPASTPTILLLRRVLRGPDDLLGLVNFVVTEETVLLRKSGSVELEEWAREGAPLTP